jgi:hypothetical protein
VFEHIFQELYVTTEDVALALAVEVMDLTDVVVGG